MNPSLKLHLKCEAYDTSLQNARHLPQRRANAVVPRKDGIAVQRVEQVDLPAEGLAAGAKVLSEVQIELVVPRIVQRTRPGQHDRFGVRAAAGKQSCGGRPGDGPAASCVALQDGAELYADGHRVTTGELELVRPGDGEFPLIAESSAVRGVGAGLQVRVE